LEEEEEEEEVRFYLASSGRFPEEDRGAPMVRIIVTTNNRGSNEHGVVFDEEVCPEHMSDEHAALQLLERLGWAVGDAERAPAAARP
jgi:hypothetical protein